MNTPMKKGQRLTEAGKAKVRELREGGAKLADIARQMNLSIGTVWNYCKGQKRGAAPAAAETPSAPQES